MSIVRMSHHRVVEAALPDVYRLVADVTYWPVIFEPSVLVRHLDRTPTQERFRLWATVNGEVKNWTSRREFVDRQHRITFEQERSAPPIATMGGQWTFEEVGARRTKITLDHHFSVIPGGDQEAIADAVDRNSVTELATLARVAELGYPVSQVLHTFEDKVVLDAPAAELYEFVYRSDRWPDHVPHVGRVELTEDEPGVQLMEMDTVTAGSVPHTTRSIRICLPAERIDYKQLVPPAMLFGHSGSWEFADSADGAVVTARHLVAINPEVARETLGVHTTLADARSYLAEALGTNSRNTLLCGVREVADRRAETTKSPR